MGKKYQIIYADPPWDYNVDTGCDGGRLNYKRGLSAKEEYPTMKLSDIKNLPVKDICDDNSLLFIWTTGPQFPSSIEVINSWGFKYRTIAFVWNKIMTCPGIYTLSSCEFCIVAKRGKIPVPRGSRNIRQFIELKRDKHSKKPDEVMKSIRRMFPSQKKIELFARVSTVGWDSIGNEIDGKNIDASLKELL
jgi:N6-adenosine-specific RNA methylase IME4